MHLQGTQDWTWGGSSLKRPSRIWSEKGRRRGEENQALSAGSDLPGARGWEAGRGWGRRRFWTPSMQSVGGVQTDAVCARDAVPCMTDATASSGTRAQDRGDRPLCKGPPSSQGTQQPSWRLMELDATRPLARANFTELLGTGRGSHAHAPPPSACTAGPSSSRCPSGSH